MKDSLAHSSQSEARLQVMRPPNRLPKEWWKTHGIFAFHSPWRDCRQESQSIKPLTPSLASTHRRPIGHHVWRFYTLKRCFQKWWQHVDTKTCQKSSDEQPIPRGALPDSVASPIPTCICAWCRSLINGATPMATPMMHQPDSQNLSKCSHKSIISKNQ